jgi:hypothetical protein
MLERVIENWLDKATERSFQQPYCYILSADGHTIIHSTRHSAMELGKDIITINRHGTPCAFQLKTGNISLAKWRSKVNPQIDDLVYGQINHPSVDNSRHHISYLVTNGNIEEEVSRAIDDRNRTWKDQGLPYCLKTIVRGQILEKATNLGIDLWPSELTEIKTLLEMFLESGQGVLPKEKLVSLFESTFPLKLADSENEPSKTHCERVIASAAILCAIATSSFSNERNHVAEIEAWMLYISYVLALAERWELSTKVYEGEFAIATQSIYNSLANLCDEIKEQEYLVEGDLLADSYIYNVRVTWLLGLMSIYALWRGSKGEPKDEADDFLREFCKEKQIRLDLWGEAAIPQFLAFLWYSRKISATSDPDDVLRHLISEICEQNEPKGDGLLASPYYEADDILPEMLGVAEEPLMDSFSGQSYTLEGLIHLYVRGNSMQSKQSMKSLWPGVTRLMYQSFEPEDFCDFFRWRNENGKNWIVSPQHTQDWEELRKLASESDGGCIPPSIKNEPILLLLFLCVYPHRMNAEILRWLDAQMKQIQIPK